MRHPFLVAVAVVLAVTLSACGSGGGEAVSLGGLKATPSTLERPWGTVTAPPTLEKAEEPNDADVTFAEEMITHHQQAIELADNLLVHEDIDDRIAASARFISSDQEVEIETMTLWLQAWESTLLGSSSEHHGSSGSHTSMPGMVPQERVDGLLEMTDAEAEIEFVVLMLEHHEGAIEMSQDYLGSEQNSFTRSSAQHIIREQTIEIEYLTIVLDELCEDSSVSTCPTS